MLAKYEAVCYELLHPAQVKAIRAKAPIAYVVMGSLEWHGFQNPLGTDALKAHAVCCEAALRHGGVVLPPFYQGLLGEEGWGPEGWTGYTLGYNQDATFEAAMLGVVRALVAGGWKVIVGVTGHDVPPQVEAFRRALEKGTKDTDATGLALMEGTLHKPTANVPLTMDHAGAWETSCMMYAWPDKVDLEELTRRGLCRTDDVHEIPGPSGIAGRSPLKFASAEMGCQIIERCGDLIGRRAAETLQKRDAGPA